MTHDDDLARLLKTMGGVSFVDRRDTAIVRVLLDSGCRRAELAGIDADDLDLRAREVTLRSIRGGRTRIVPIGRGPRWRCGSNDESEPSTPRPTRRHCFS